MNVNTQKHYDIVIIGAGAAGLMCASEAGKRSRHVLIIDHAQTIGIKILLSGGGHCNFTNLDISAESYLSANKHFCKSALAQFNQHDFIALLEKYKISYHERKLGQLFCDDVAKQIVDMLTEECRENSVDIQLNTRVLDVFKKDQFIIKTSKGIFSTEKLVVATGGLSIPKIGASGFGYRLAKYFGLSVTKTAPALVPFIFNDRDLTLYRTLSGISFEASVRCGDVTFFEHVLITHRGLSGPAILQISSYWKPGQSIHLHLLPELNWSEFLKVQRSRHPKQELKTILGKMLAKRLIVSFMKMGQIQNRIMHQMSDHHIIQLTDFLENIVIKPQDTEGYGKAEVTLGGVDTNELSSKTLECHSVAGLYFIGEVVDVTGRLGGYNLQWAWSSGVAAGRSV